ncbi:MAG TPA: MFS transporter [Candidatus Methylacidiphilales bacterium]|jgi:MFS family permease|nr:MFS transporter [Candidatus Methylacidiphilales bacterium]
MPSETAPISFRSILGERNFARLWYGQIISSMGDRFYNFALLYVILGIKQGIDVGKDSARVTFCAMLPGLLLAPFYGWLVDRFSRRWVMFYSDIARAVLTLTILDLWFHSHSLPAVFAVVFLMGAFNGLFIPARQAALPQIVSARQLITANSLISLIGVIANFIGIPIASFVVSIFGARSSFLFNSLGFLASAWCVYHIRADLSPAPHGPDASDKDRVGTWRGTLAGWRVLREQPELGALVLVNSAFSFISAMALITILQQIVVTVDLRSVHLLVNTLTKFLSIFAPKPPVFEIRTLAFGLLMAAIGLGLGAGAAICGVARRRSRSKALPYLALGLLGVALIGFSRLHEYWPAVAGAAFMGVLSAFIVIPIEARLQNDVDDARRGRLFALRNLCTTTSWLLGLAVNLNGALLASVGPSRLIGYIGIAAMAIAAALAFANASTLSSFWSTHRRKPPYSPE